jgi:hypothetical protein
MQRNEIDKRRLLSKDTIYTTVLKGIEEVVDWRSYFRYW